MPVKVRKKHEELTDLLLKEQTSAKMLLAIADLSLLGTDALRNRHLRDAPPAKPEAQKDLQQSLLVTCIQQASDFVLSRSVCSQVSNLKVPRAQVTTFGKLL